MKLPLLAKETDQRYTQKQMTFLPAGLLAVPLPGNHHAYYKRTNDNRRVSVRENSRDRFFRSKLGPPGGRKRETTSSVLFVVNHLARWPKMRTWSNPPAAQLRSFLLYELFCRKDRLKTHWTTRNPRANAQPAVKVSRAGTTRGSVHPSVARRPARAVAPATSPVAARSAIGGGRLFTREERFQNARRWQTLERHWPRAVANVALLVGRARQASCAPVSKR